MGESVGTIGLDLVLNQNQFKSQMKGITSLAKKAGATLAGAFAAKKIVDFGEQCIELGSDLAEVQNVVDVAFPKMNATIDKFAKNAAAQFGLSETMAKRYAGTFGAMSQAFGFSEEEAAKMSTTLTGLAGDVASFYNISQDEAYTKIKSVFTGETESLKDLGVVMTQTALDQYALANGFGKTTAKMTEQEKVALRYQFVQNQLSKASGDFVRTSDSWANQTRILNLQLDSIKATLGQGFINLFSPIIKQVNVLLGKLGTLANAFKSFTELITGKKSDNSSISTMADDASKVSDNASDAASNVSSIGDAAKKAAKKLGSLASWDELEVKTDDSDSNSEASGASTLSGTSVDYGKAADISNTEFTKLGKTMDTIKNKFLKMGKLFKKGFSIGFQSEGLEKIKIYLSDIAKDIKEIFTDPEVLSAASKWADTIALNLGKVTGSVASIGVSIATMLIGGISKFLEQNKDYIKGKIVALFDISSQISTIVGNFSVALADIFMVFEGDNAQQIIADILAIFTIVNLDLIVLCQKIGRDVLECITEPIIANKDKIKNTLQETIEPISGIVSTIRTAVSDTFSAIQKAYDEYVNPAFKNITSGLSTILSKVVDGYNAYILPVIDYISKDISDLYTKYIKPLVSNVAGCIGRVINAVGELFNFLSPIIGWIASNLLSVLGPVILSIWNSVKVAIEWISNAINTLLGVLNGLIDFIVGVFTGDWNKAWNGIKTVVTSIFNGIKSAITIVLDAIKGTISTIAVAITNKIKSTMEGIKTVFENAWKAIKTIFSDPGQFFSSVWNGIKSAFSHVTDWFRDTFSVAWQAVKDVFSKGGKIFAGIKEGIVSVFKTVVNGLISGINMIISTPFKKINQLLNDIRDTEVLGFTPFDFIPKDPLPIPQIPKLAKGAVIPPRAPFLAMLGDQSSGTNIEAPLETIKQAVREVQNESGSSTSGNDENIIVNVYLEGDADGVFKLIKAEATKFKNRTGKPAFS